MSPSPRPARARGQQDGEHRVRFRTPDNRQSDRRGFRTKRETQDFAATLEVSKLTGQYVEVSRARATVDELGRDWLAQKIDVEPSTRSALESAWRVHVQPRWRSTPVSKVEHSAVKEWVAALTNSGRSAPTVKRAFGVLSSILDDAVRARRILHDPCSAVRTPRKVSREHTYLTHAQLHALAAEAGEHRMMVLVMGYTGLRWGRSSDFVFATQTSPVTGHG